MLGSTSITSKAKRRRTDGKSSPTLEVSRLGDEDEVEDLKVNGTGGKKNVDDLLPLGVRITSCNGCHKLTRSVFQHHHPLESSSRRPQRKNGPMSSMSTKRLSTYVQLISPYLCTYNQFHELVPEMAREVSVFRAPRLPSLTISTPSPWTTSKKKRCTTLKWETVSSLRHIRPPERRWWPSMLSRSLRST